MNPEFAGNSVDHSYSKKKTTKISKFLSLVLRHKPETIGLILDSQGWANTRELINLAQNHGHQIDMSWLEFIVVTNDKQRFSFNEDKSKIRANQGHSIKVDLNFSPQKPPEYLFHGTATRFLDSIYRQGLLKQNRLHVHLSSDRETAMKVGKRHGKAVVLIIKAQAMFEAGFNFFLSENNVWLTDSVPSEYIIFAESTRLN